MTDMLTVRVTPQEKQALRIAAAEANLNMSAYVLRILRKHSDLPKRVTLLAHDNPHLNRNNSKKKR